MTNSSPAHLFAIKGNQKRGLENFKYVIKICQIEDKVFRINYGMSGQRY